MIQLYYSEVFSIDIVLYIVVNETAALTKNFESPQTVFPVNTENDFCLLLV